MSLFNYSKSAPAPDVVKQAQAQKGAERGREPPRTPVPEDTRGVQDQPERVVSAQPEAAEREPETRDASGPALLAGFPADRVLPSVRPGMLRVDFDDPESDTGKGSLFVATGDVRPSVSSDGAPMPGRVDVTVCDGDGRQTPYFIVKDGKGVRSDRASADFLSSWEQERSQGAGTAREASMDAKTLDARSKDKEGGLAYASE